MKLLPLLLLALATIGLAHGALAAPFGRRDADADGTNAGAQFNAADAELSGNDVSTDGAAEGPSILPVKESEVDVDDAEPTPRAPLTYMDICNYLPKGQRLLVKLTDTPGLQPRLLETGECATYAGRGPHPLLPIDDVLVTLYRENPARGAGWWAAAAVAGAVRKEDGAHPEASASDRLALQPGCGASPGKRAFRFEGRFPQLFGGAENRMQVSIMRLRDQEGSRAFRVSAIELGSTLAGQGCRIEAHLQFPSAAGNGTGNDALQPLSIDR
ncbi:hypothetical protein DFJ74DRAFT_647458 [Hyaloraphidium curvatum]|nr:hypothetical protein DFJ74DRAFT_647458 [Hyaloraphidium curvatum]